MSNIFKQFRDYQSRKVDNPSYEPLRQGILVLSPEEEKRRKHNEYMKVYREKNREKLNEYQRNYWKNRRVLIKREWLFGIQKDVYDYLVKQYQKWENLSRWAMIAKALWIKDNSVYTAIFQLVKKWYVGKWTYGRYLLLKFPEWEEFKEEKVTSKKSRKHVDGEDYSPWYVGQLKHSIKTGEKIISELKERVVYLEEKLEKVQVIEVNEENKSDYLKKLEDQNTKLADEVIMLRKIVKYLSRYID